MLATLRVPLIILAGSLSLAGCSSADLFGTSNSSDVTTSSLSQTQAQVARVDPICGNLALEVDTLRREGVADKVERAAAKKYKMTATDLAKANQLNKVNADYQEKCSTLPRTAAAPVAPAGGAAPTTAAAPPAAKATVAKAAVGASKAQ